MAMKTVLDGIDGGLEWLLALQRQFLKDVFFEDESEVKSSFEYAIAFAQQFRSEIPKPAALNQFVKHLSADLRNTLGLPSDDDLDDKKLPPDWKKLAGDILPRFVRLCS